MPPQRGRVHNDHPQPRAWSPIWVDRTGHEFQPLRNAALGKGVVVECAPCMRVQTQFRAAAQTTPDRNASENHSQIQQLASCRPGSLLAKDGSRDHPTLSSRIAYGSLAVGIAGARAQGLRGLGDRLDRALFGCARKRRQCGDGRRGAGGGAARGPAGRCEPALWLPQGRVFLGGDHRRLHRGRGAADLSRGLSRFHRAAQQFTADPLGLAVSVLATAINAVWA